MNNTIRYIIAGILIFLIILLQPLYLKWLGYDDDYDSVEQSAPSKTLPADKLVFEEKKFNNTIYEDGSVVGSSGAESFITISTPLYIATLSNKSGGSFVSYTLTEEGSDRLKYIGGYDDDGFFQSDLPVSLIMPSKERCVPCLAYFDDRSDSYHFINQSFALLNFSSKTDTIYLDFTDSIELKYVLLNAEGKMMIEKSVVFSANKYINNHFFKINDDNFDYSSNLEILWAGGLRPTEEKEDEDVQYSSGIISQAGEIEDIQTKTSDEIISREVFKGRTEWVGVRTKYFISALIVEGVSEYAVLSAENVSFGERKQTPIYSAGIGYPLDVTSLSSSVYLGPLDVDHVSKTGTDLDAAMNWGFSLIRPISKGVLWVLKFLHNTLHLNYGFVLLLFAVLVRIITGPPYKKEL